jgi:hypothetical protein
MEQLNTFSNNATRQIIETVRTVQGMPKNSLPSKSNPRRSLKARITATIDDPGNPGTPLEFEFEAEQVSWDGSAWQAITNGKEWDSTKPLYVDSGGVVGDVLTADPVSNGANSTVWLAIKPAGGGGDTKVRLKVKATATSANGVIFLCDIIDNAGTVLTASVNVRQKKFASAKFYINEIIYADAEGSDYLADAYLAGIGVG